MESVILGLADHALSVDPEALSTLTQRGSVHRFMNFSVSWKRKIKKTACMCYACHKQIQRNINNDSFKPRWRKLESKESKRCGIADCKAIASKVTQMATTEEIEYTPKSGFIYH